MPANLTPDYERAEAAYKAAGTDEDRITALREMFATIPKHKGTEKMQADIKHRLSLLRKQVAKAPARTPDLFHVPHAGAGQVVIAGMPNVGKSHLVQTLSGGHAPVKVADYPFTTPLPVPGMAAWQDVQLEFVDTPPVTKEHVPPGLMGTFRNSDILALVVDASVDPLEETEELLAILAGRELQLKTVPRNQLDPGNQHEHVGLIVATKVDLAGPEAVVALAELYAGKFEVLGVSGTTGDGLDRLKSRCWELLSMIRVYTKEPGQGPDMSKPFVLDAGATVEDLAVAIHRDLAARMKSARLWRKEHTPGMQVHRTEGLRDGDVVEVHG